MSLESDIRSIFPDAKVGNGYAKVRCPYHGGGHERHPSMSILLQPRDGVPAGFAKCFACGYKGTFADIAEDFGLMYVPEEKEVVLSEEQTNPIPKLHLSTYTMKKDMEYNYSPYLASRGIFEATQKKFKTYERDDEHKVYMPVFDKSGRFLYANARATDKKMFFVQSNAIKTLAGLEEIDFAKPIAIVESQINAMTLDSAAYAHACATLGVANQAALAAIKDAIGPFLIMFDGDGHGENAAKEIIDYLGAYRCIKYTFNPGEDVNDLWRACNFNPDLFYDEMEKRKQR